MSAGSAEVACRDIAGLSVLILSDAAPDRNGVGAYYRDLLEQISGRVGRIELMSPRIIDGKWRAGVVLPLPGDRTQKFCLPNPWKLNRLINEMQPDVMVVATPGFYGLTGAFLAGRKHIPFLTGLHTSFERLTELYWPDSIRGRLIEKCFNAGNRYLFRRTRAVLGNSDSILDQARAMGAANVTLIGTPVASDFISTPAPAYTGTLHSLLFAGRLAKEKNIEEILEAVRALPSFKFSIAGDGPLRKLVERGANEHDNLTYLGWLSRESLRAAMDSHDALLLPSYFETFGTIALEAMARGRLVIVSPGCGITEWPRFRSGLLLIRERQSVTRALEQIADMPPAGREAVARRGHEAAILENREVVDTWTRILLETAGPATVTRK